MNEQDEYKPLASSDEFISDFRRLGWIVALPLAFVIAVTFLSCGGGIALVIAACRF